MEHSSYHGHRLDAHMNIGSTASKHESWNAVKVAALGLAAGTMTTTYVAGHGIGI